MNQTRLIASIKAHEGYRELPYRDSLGYWTIGYGHLLEDDLIPTERVTVGSLLDYITDPSNHEKWLEDDIDGAMELAQRWLGFMWNDLNEVRKEVVVEMAFQLGTKLTQFAKFRGAIANRDWERAVTEMLDSKWADQTPNRASDLAERFKDGEV